MTGAILDEDNPIDAPRGADPNLSGVFRARGTVVGVLELPQRELFPADLASPDAVVINARCPGEDQNGHCGERSSNWPAQQDHELARVIPSNPAE
jgi:hypothetical protein